LGAGNNSARPSSPALRGRREGAAEQAVTRIGRKGVEMVDMVDFRQEARGCLRLAEEETQAELKTILMGMALGWLTLASEVQPAGHDEEPMEEFVEPTALDTIDEPT
jgi:hypothetical protein